MTTKELQQFVSDVDRKLADRRLGDAFEVMRNMARALSAWEISDRISAVEQSYSYMLSYLVNGTADPSRDNLYTSLLIEAGVIRDLIVRTVNLLDTPTLYYNTLRSVNSHREESFAQLFADFRHACDAMSPFNTISSGGVPSESDRLRMEMIERDIFNRLWVAFPLRADDARLISEFILDDDLPVPSRALAVSGVTLGLLECYDERRLDVLFDAYGSNVTDISVRALVGIAIAIDKYKDSAVSATLRNRIEALRELSGWHDDIKQTFVELIRTNDTERISGKLRKEIFPDIQKMGRDMAERFRESADAEIAGDEINPEWENIISDEKVRNNLKELGELQQEGADVFMATFAGLKQFPFFNDVAGWFMPFNPERTVVTSLGLGELVETVSSLIGNLPYVCDSDKYSMLLSLSMMPSSQRRMMMEQLSRQKQDIDEAVAQQERSLQPLGRRAAINNYVLSIYRFYKLFRRKGEFYNPFDRVANPVGISLFVPDFDNVETLMSLGEFYFKVGLYDYSRLIFNRLDDISMPEASRYQKLGFCCEKLGDFDSAASYYEQADLLEENNVWNLRRLLAVLRRLGRYGEAVSVAERLSRLLPDDPAIAVTLASMYISAADYPKAITMLHKAEYLDETSSRTWRPLAWALFLDRQFDVSKSYYDRVLTDKPTATDFLNMGHLEWARGNLAEALSYYRRSAAESSVEALIDSIRQDSKPLETAGVDVTLMPLIIDAIIYDIKNNH